MSENHTPQPELHESSSLSTPVAGSASYSEYNIPIAIIVGALIVSSAILYTGNQNTGATPSGSNVAGQEADGDPTLQEQQTPETEVAPITEGDHIRGNPDAPIVIVEYSDFDCPFCKRFHEETMMRVIDEYGESGNVAWVYRQFPLEQLHPNAPKISEASECVAELGGNEAFWTFSDLIFGERSTNSPTDMDELPLYARTAGVSEAAFTECLDSGKYTEQIAEDVQEAINAGARGTPYSILIAGERQIVINGAQPYGNVKASIDAVLETLNIDPEK